MINQLHDLGLSLLAFAGYLAVAVPVRRVGGRAIAWAWDHRASFDWNLFLYHGGRWAGRPALVAPMIDPTLTDLDRRRNRQVDELVPLLRAWSKADAECQPGSDEPGEESGDPVVPEPPATATSTAVASNTAKVELQHGEIGDGEAFAAELHAIVEQIKAEDSGEIAPLPLTGELTEQERRATIAVLQERTVVLPVLDLHEICAQREIRARFDEIVKDDPVAAALLAEARARLDFRMTAPTGEYPTVTIPSQRVEVSA